MSRVVTLVFVVLVAQVMALLPAPAQAQISEEAEEFILQRAGEAAECAGQLAKQGGRLAKQGGRVKADIAGIGGSMQQILTNFDIYACGTAVMALGIKHRRLAVAAAGARPADPELDRMVSEMGDLIARLQEACNKYVYDPATGVNRAGVPDPGTGDDEEEAEEETETGPTRSVQERICLRQCSEIYNHYARARGEDRNARREAERERQAATEKRSEATEKDRVADEAEAKVETERNTIDRLQRELTAAKTQAEQMRIASELGELNLEETTEFAQKKRAEADQAEKEASEAEARAAREEADANSKYTVRIELYDEWKARTDRCVAQAWQYDKVRLDIWDLFPLMDRHRPAPPPFYTLPTPPSMQPATESGTRTSRLVTPPVGIAGGTLVGVVVDDVPDEEPEETQVAISLPDGTETEAIPESGGAFVVAMPVFTGTVAFAIAGAEGEPIAIEVVDEVTEGFAEVPPDYVLARSPIWLGKPYRHAAINDGGFIDGEVPVATALGPDGETGVSTIDLPAWVQPGPVLFALTGVDGEQVVIESQAYWFVNAWIEQEKLRSGQVAQFGYELDFGEGPKTITIVIQTTGPIVYDRVGQPQTLRVDADGRATFTGTVRALQGSPAGIPFSIVPTFFDGG